MKPQEWQVLSTYIDNQLSPGEKAAVEKRLSTDPEIQKALEELLQTRALLRRMPQHPVPHNFTLTPEMVSARPSVADGCFRFQLLFCVGKCAAGHQHCISMGPGNFFAGNAGQTGICGYGLSL